MLWLLNCSDIGKLVTCGYAHFKKRMADNILYNYSLLKGASPWGSDYLALLQIGLPQRLLSR